MIYLTVSNKVSDVNYRVGERERERENCMAKLEKITVGSRRNLV